ncbi:MAG: aldo/keto reductase [Micavibrio sp.]|nr:aldo/keto reductase [Micavibrio sp.]|tara:strand:+ start:30 stop:815 length:786 start_codon:yes stop_codon:yes gene_type:complete
MKPQELSQTDLKLSPLGLGTVKFGRNEGVKYPAGFDLPEERELAALLDLAQGLGVNTLDTAPAYGLSEERLGRLLKGRRADWVIIGKAGEEFENGRSHYDFSPEFFETSLMRTLKRLGTDYLDIFLIHSDGQDMQNLSDDLIAKMHDFKTRGLVRAIGASTKTVHGGIRALETMDTAMVTYNQDYQDEKPVLDFAADHQKQVLLKKVLSSGHNTDIEEAFEFAFGHRAVCAAIVGTITPAHLRANIGAVNKAVEKAVGRSG